MTVFVDTSAIMAVIDEDEVRHREAAPYWAYMVDNDVLMVTTSCVFVEAIALLQARVGMRAVREFESRMLPYLEIRWLREGPHPAGLSHLLGEDRRQLSLVDVISLDVIKAEQLEYAFAFDKHFTEAGFPLPPLA